MATPSNDQAEVILVGSGAPLRGMGWYHAVQMLGGECPSAKLCHVVEPWFLGAGSSGPGGAEFAEFRTKAEEDHSVQFHASMAEVPPASGGARRLALISGRTADNPRLLSEAIAAGCTTVYLEKPGESRRARRGAPFSFVRARGRVGIGYRRRTRVRTF